MGLGNFEKECVIYYQPKCRVLVSRRCNSKRMDCTLDDLWLQNGYGLASFDPSRTKKEPGGPASIGIDVAKPLGQMEIDTLPRKDTRISLHSRQWEVDL